MKLTHGPRSPHPPRRDSPERTGPSLSPGATLSACRALTAGQESYTPEQVAYLIALAYETGRRHRWDEDMAEIWAEQDPPRRCTIVRPRAKKALNRRKAERMAEYERLSGPPRFGGGLPKPPAYPAGERSGPGPFPTFASQTWLSAEDVAYLRREARRAYAIGWAA